MPAFDDADIVYGTGGEDPSQKSTLPRASNPAVFNEVWEYGLGEFILEKMFLLWKFILIFNFYIFFSNCRPAGPLIGRSCILG